jgi:RES domain-containing protein
MDGEPAYDLIPEIPSDPALGLERLAASDLPGWNLPHQAISRAFGDQWLAEARSSIVMVPSLVTAGREHNVLLNPAHPNFARITHSQPEPVAWDERLFAK